MLTRRLLLGAAFAAMSTGCYGKFALTRKLYEWNGSFGNKFVSSLIMWIFLIIPVYGVCGFVDFVVLNLIEFWSGSNPMGSVEHEDGSKTRFVRLDANTVRVTREADGQREEFDVVMVGENAGQVRALDGRVLVTGEALPGGELAMNVNGEARVVTADELRGVQAMPNKALAASQLLSRQAWASR